MAKGRKTGGRRPGSSNKATADARMVFQALFEEQAPRASGWFADIAATNPTKALECLLRLAEYHIPKLATVKVDLGQMSVDEILRELERRASTGPNAGAGANLGPSTGPEAP